MDNQCVCHCKKHCPVHLWIDAKEKMPEKDGNYVVVDNEDFISLVRMENGKFPTPIKYWKNPSSTSEITTDFINHPPHYNSSKAKCPSCERRIECIDITRHMNFNIGNAVKYLWRYEHKGGIEDLKKAIWYIQDEVDKCK